MRPDRHPMAAVDDTEGKPRTGGGRGRVVHIATGHRPFDTRVFQKECRTLAAAGHEVYLVVPHDRVDVVGGVHIVPLPEFRGRFDRLVIGSIRAFAVARRLRPRLVHLHDPPLLVIGVLFAMLRIPVIYDSHEDVPRLVIERPWIPRPLRRPLTWLVALVEGAAVRCFALVISAEDEGAKRFPPERTVVVRNHVLLSEFESVEVPYAERAPIVAYVGDLTRQRGIVELVEAVGQLPDELGVELKLAGEFNTPGLEATVRDSPGWPRTTHLGWLARVDVAELLASARLGAVLWHPTKKHAEGAVPVKLFEYMAAGLPVVASDFPLLRAVTDQGVGLAVDPLDVDAIAAAMERMLTDVEQSAGMAARGVELARSRYSWEAEAPTLLAAYDRVLPG